MRKTPGLTFRPLHVCLYTYSFTYEDLSTHVGTQMYIHTHAQGTNLFLYSKNKYGVVVVVIVVVVREPLGLWPGYLE